tara:strand:- start:108 stop:416 length:309 start_codon:yes stop_codon:yes gene_type:complete
MIYVTFGSKEEAINICRKLVEKEFVACANIINNVVSVYSWEGQVQEDAEVVAILKTSDVLVDSVIAAIKEDHSYDIPAISVIEVTKNNEEFTKWLETCVKIS